MDYKDRLTQFIESQKLNVDSFEKKCGLTPTTIQKILAGPGKEGKGKHNKVDVLLKIAESFPKLNIDWLINGRGGMEYNEKFTPESLILEMGRLKIERTNLNIEIGELKNQLQAIFRENMELKTELAKERGRL
jgi:transcriptional regulator with XRE-family HTH domain